MPRYFFHIRDGDTLQYDLEGADAHTLDEAEQEARLAAREILAEKILAGDVIEGQSFEITNEHGTVLRTVKFLSEMRLS
ncbi:DUF6894 family protein [Limoniibacter endophyticus]|uniref:DUF6894 domain-containing protein n=1 Tax=Limoniibacter endophyticus TaxID=1565040 RepID=A0A8J3DJM8_9HYPH|nr:hypothetical protein [Limoniibacter endophyticus]GHC78715.1 hypothetical protein GCM10010136_30680 [Limoniibacter endophyticus]